MVKAEMVELGNLTPAQGKIVPMVCEGASDKVIAQRLAISIKTVQAQLSSIYLKIGIREASINSRVTMVSVMVSRGMVRLTNTTLLAVLMVGAAGFDDHALHRSRMRAHRQVVHRSVSKEL